MSVACEPYVVLLCPYDRELLDEVTVNELWFAQTIRHLYGDTIWRSKFSTNAMTDHQVNVLHPFIRLRFCTLSREPPYAAGPVKNP